MGTPAPKWVESWEEALRLLDQYPWVRLHPMAVHTEFVERVSAAVAERLAGHGGRQMERTRAKWKRLFAQAIVH